MSPKPNQYVASILFCCGISLITLLGIVFVYDTILYIKKNTSIEVKVEVNNKEITYEEYREITEYVKRHPALRDEFNRIAFTDDKKISYQEYYLIKELFKNGQN